MAASAPSKHGGAHVPALDGLRGIAVLGVFLFHADGLLTGGYLGVDLFFVLSGYLITGIILGEQARTSRVDLWNFWVRRARRLLPALFLLVFVVAAYSRMYAKKDELANIRADALSTLAYVANWRAIFSHKSYWELFASPSPLEHTWSLAIEEQFYVVWPLLVTGLLVAMKRGKKALFWACVALAIGSMLLMLRLYDGENASRVYMGTDTRAVGLLAGAALSCVLPMDHALPKNAARALDIVGLVSLAGLAYAWWKIDGQSPFLYRGGLWLTEIGCLILIACAVGAKEGLIARIFSIAPLRGLGTISYGVYLWHWPVDCLITLNRTHMGPLKLTLLRGAVTLAIALVSYRFLEKPIRTRGLPFGRAWIVVPSAFVLASLAIWFSTVPGQKPLPPPVRITAQAPFIEKRYPGPYDMDAHSMPPASELKEGTLRVMTLGDSVAEFLGIALRHRQYEMHAFVAARGVGDCSIFPSDPRIIGGQKLQGTSCADDWVKDVEELHPDVTLITLGGGYLGSHTCETEWRMRYEERLYGLMESIRKDGGRIVVTIVPEPVGRWRTPDIHQRVSCFDESLARTAAKFGADTLDLRAHVCPTPECIMFSDDEPIRPDGLHFDGKGSEETARWVLSELARIFKSPPPLRQENQRPQ